MLIWLAVALCLAVGRGDVAVAEADGVCLTRDEAITLIAHKADVEQPGTVPKEKAWGIGARESGLQMCVGGRVKVSPTGDRGLLQMNPAGVWRNCLVNRWCNRPDLIDDAEYQVDVMIAYYKRYGDLCPWNPDPRGNYLPGCGYK